MLVMMTKSHETTGSSFENKAWGFHYVWGWIGIPLTRGDPKSDAGQGFPVHSPPSAHTMEPRTEQRANSRICNSQLDAIRMEPNLTVAAKFRQQRLANAEHS